MTGLESLEELVFDNKPFTCVDYDQFLKGVLGVRSYFFFTYIYFLCAHVVCICI